MKIVYYPNPKLLKPCVPAKSETTMERVKLATEMWNIMHENNGVGLAAPQVGLKTRMFVWKHNNSNHVIWNPSLKSVSGHLDSVEGCLSFPGVSVTKKRARHCVLCGEGMNGLPLEIIGNPTTTRIWQHEIDHLDGKVIIDDMSVEEKNANKEALRVLLKKYKSFRKVVGIILFILLIIPC